MRCKLFIASKNVMEYVTKVSYKNIKKKKFKINEWNYINENVNRKLQKNRREKNNNKIVELKSPLV